MNSAQIGLQWSFVVTLQSLRLELWVPIAPVGFDIFPRAADQYILRQELRGNNPLPASISPSRQYDQSVTKV